ncbi:unnamed protein product [Echinostoma caproni]|uniref:BPL/LPL catalytic domain-containing protein n=1 Tax=Echinostoma caproni TaxID=27848 RepID=A0A183B1C6_9TREM|nr:unnamed protein product [Echinostoma caproni]
MIKWPDTLAEAGTPTCIAVTETWLKPDVTITGLHSPGFMAYRWDRTDGRIGGGSLVLVAEHLTQTAVTNLWTANIQSTGCFLKQPQSEVEIMCTYRSPWFSTEEDDQLIAYLRQVVGQAKWVQLLSRLAEGNATSSSFGEKLLDLLLTKDRDSSHQTPNEMETRCSYRALDTEGLLLAASQLQWPEDATEVHETWDQVKTNLILLADAFATSTIST